jgi:hypothetical protein
MARITMEQIAGLPDPQNTEWFEFLLGNVPGGGDTQDLTLLCQTASWGGVSFTATDVALHGFTIKGGGRKEFPRTLSITYQEVADMRVSRKLKQWMEVIRGTRSGTSQGYKKDWSVTGKLIVYDTTGLAVDAIKYYRTWPTDLTDISMDGASSSPMQVSATFSYDWHESDFIPSR